MLRRDKNNKDNKHDKPKRKISKRMKYLLGGSMVTGVAVSVAVPVVAYAVPISTGQLISGDVAAKEVSGQTFNHKTINMTWSTLDGKPAYCTMYFFNNPTNGMQYTYDSENVDGLFTIMHEGYNGSNTLGTLDARDSYEATQLAVWFYEAHEYDTSSSSNINGDYMFLTPSDVTPVSAEGPEIIQEAMTLYNNAINNPLPQTATVDFGNKGYTLTKQGDELISPVIHYTSNTSGTLNFTLKGAPAGAQIINRVGTSSGTFQIEVPYTDEDLNFTVETTGSVPFSQINFYEPASSGGDFQREVGIQSETAQVSASASAVVSYTKPAIKTADVDVTKESAETGDVLPGATFELINSSGEDIGTETTGSNGIAQFTNVDPGTYTIKETVAPKGYTLNPSTTTITVGTTGQTVDAVVKDGEIDGKFTVTKEGTSGVKLANCTFGVYQNGTLIEKITTNSDGVAQSTDLPYGEYEVKELVAPTGYELSSQVMNVNINQENENYQFVFDDSPIDGYVAVKKVSSVTGDGLEGCEFGLYQNGQLLQTATTGSNGVAIFPNKEPVGEYEVKELKAPTGYQISTQVLPIDLTTQIAESGTGGTGGTAGTVFEMKDSPIQGTIEVEKQDSAGKPLAGAVFQLQNTQGQQVGQLETTNSQGQCYFQGVTYGTYHIVEVKAPTGYQLDKGYTSVTVSKNGATYTTKVTDQIITGTVVLTKYSNVDKKVLEGAKFDLYKDGTNGDNTLVGTYTTNADGEIEVPNLDYGQYYFKEEQAPQGYNLDNNEVPFQITTEGKTVNVSETDTQITGNVTIVKENETGTEKLAGAKFEVQQVEANNLSDVIKTIGTYTTNASGDIDISNLPEGVYKIVETQAPKGYTINTTPQYADINTSGENDTITVNDSVAEGTVDITKESLTTGKLIPGTTFEIRNSKGQEVVTGVTNSEGIAHFTLPEGSYTYQEIKCPPEYQINHEEYPFTITSNGQILKYYMKDAVVSGDLTITKVSESNGEKLEGAKFGVYNSQGKLVDTGVTNKDGQVTFTGLDYGDYTYKELKAPDGYMVDTKSYSFSITYQGEDVKEEVTDEQLPHTGLTPQIGIPAAIFALLFAGGFFYVTRLETEDKKLKKDKKDK